MLAVLFTASTAVGGWSTMGPNDACGTNSGGETEGHSITIRQHVCDPMPGNTFASNLGICTGADPVLSLKYPTLAPVDLSPCEDLTMENTVTSVDSVCVGDPIELSIYYEGAGLEYQWQSSTAGEDGPWTNVGSNLSSYDTTQSQTTWYRTVVTCQEGAGDPLASIPVRVALRALPCYCSSQPYTDSYMEILAVRIGGMLQYSTCHELAPGPGSSPSQYSNYTTLPAQSFLPGEHIPFFMKLGNCESGYWEQSRAAVFIDWNRNGMLTDPGELVYTTSTFMAYYGDVWHWDVDIPVPLDAAYGPTLVRVIHSEWQPYAISPCGLYFLGETEDYVIEVKDPCTELGIAQNTTATADTICQAGIGQLEVVLPAVPPYCESSSLDASSSWLTNVAFGGLNNNSGPTTYSDFTSLSGNVIAGTTFSFSATLGMPPDSSWQYSYLQVMIDWDQNGQWSAYELPWLHPSRLHIDGWVVTRPIDVPANALPGATRMRVVLRGDWIPGPPHCGTFPHGEVEDYTVIVSSNTPAHTYSWSPATFLNDPTVADPIVSGFSETTEFTVTITNSHNCSTTITVPVVVDTTDTDGDGIPDCMDICPLLPGGPGDPCDAGPGFTAGMINADCACVGVPDCMAVISATPTVVCENGASQLNVVMPSLLTYCAAASTNLTDEWIANISFAGINNTSGSTNYSDFTAIAGTVSAGNSYPFSATIGMLGDFSEFMRIYIDWDQNGEFTPDEVHSPAGCATNGCTITTNIAVPAGALNGPTRMRVVLRWQQHYFITGCGSFTFGEVEDYTLQVSDGVPGHTYSWTPTTFLNDPAVADPIAAGVTGDMEYSVSIQGLSGCISTRTVSVLVDQTDTDGDDIADCTDDCPFMPGTIGSPCDAGTGPGTGVINTNCECVADETFVTVDASAFLDGPFNSNTLLMRDDLRALGLIPFAHPYGTAPWDHTGMETIDPGVLAVTGNDAIADWVLIELRETAVPFTTLERRAALIQRNGKIVDTDGVSPVRFNVTPGNYRIAVRHRNHLGIMSGEAHFLTTNSFPVNMTVAAFPIHGNDPRKISGGRMTMWGGNANGNQTLNYFGTDSDRQEILSAVGSDTPFAEVQGVYHAADVNMDGVVRYYGTNADRQFVLFNVGSSDPFGSLELPLE